MAKAKRRITTSAATTAREMVTARIGQLRTMGSELGFDPGSRARTDLTPPVAGDDAAAKYFDPNPFARHGQRSANTD